MNKHSILFIGLDTHKEFNEVAYIEEHRGAQPVHLGRVSSSKVAVQKLVRQFESKYPGATLHFVYEAGPCGYWIYRLITSLGHCCYVVAPSLIPKKPGEKIKTDKRDALKLAKLLKSEDLTPICRIPISVCTFNEKTPCSAVSAFFDGANMAFATTRVFTGYKTEVTH